MPFSCLTREIIHLSTGVVRVSFQVSEFIPMASPRNPAFDFPMTYIYGLTISRRKMLGQGEASVGCHYYNETIIFLHLEKVNA